MIQFRRGKTLSWLKQIKPLADGQPGYDKKKHKIKVGDGTTPWFLLPSASGLSSEEILASEEDAKKRQDEVKSELGSLLGKLTGLDLGLEATGGTVITYGEEAPDENTVGQVYLQHYSTEPETDYIISYGNNYGWTFQVWKSGIAECWCRVKLNLIPIGQINSEFDTNISANTSDNSSNTNSTDQMQPELNLFQYKMSEVIKYPEFIIQNEDENGLLSNLKFNFANTPTETSTIQSSTIAWIAGTGPNSKTSTGLYSIISPYDNLDNADIYLSLHIKGNIISA